MTRVDRFAGPRVQPGRAAELVIDEEDAAVPTDAIGPVLRFLLDSGATSKSNVK